MIMYLQQQQPQPKWLPFKSLKVWNLFLETKNL